MSVYIIDKCERFVSQRAGCGKAASPDSVRGVRPQGVRLLDNKMTSKALDAIGSIGGPRCCKRDSYMAIISAIDYVAENFNIQMEKPVIKCIHSDKNNQCIKERCPFHE